MAIFRPIIASDKQSTVNDTGVRESVNDLEHALRSSQFNNARQILGQIATQLRMAIRQHNIRILNTITSVEEGMASNEISPTKARRELKAAFDEYKLEVERALDSLVIPSQEDEARSLTDVLNRSTETLLSFEKNRSAVRERIKSQGVVVTLAPVLVMSTPGLDVEKLRRVGFKAKSLEGYAVLEEQTVVGLSVDVVLSRIPGRKLEEDGTPAKPSTPEQRNEIKDEFLETVIDRFRARKLIQLGGEFSSEQTSWFWLVPADHVKLFKSCTTAAHTVNSFSVKSWGFPFSNKN
jgi:hypothetical protein